MYTTWDILIVSAQIANVVYIGNYVIAPYKKCHCVKRKDYLQLM